MDRPDPFLYLVGRNILVLDLRTKLIGFVCKYGIIFDVESKIILFVTTNNYKFFVAAMNNGTLLEGTLDGVLDIKVKVLQNDIEDLAEDFNEKLLSISEDRTGIFFALFMSENGKLRKVELKKSSLEFDSLFILFVYTKNKLNF